MPTEVGNVAAVRAHAQGGRQRCSCAGTAAAEGAAARGQEAGSGVSGVGGGRPSLTWRQQQLASHQTSPHGQAGRAQRLAVVWQHSSNHGERAATNGRRRRAGSRAVQLGAAAGGLHRWRRDVDSAGGGWGGIDKRRAWLISWDRPWMDSMA